MANAKTEGQTAGTMGYTAWQQNTEVADNATVVINHGNDTRNARIVTVINKATGAVVAVGPDAGDNVGIVHTSGTSTTVTNLMGATKNLLVSIFIPA